MMTTIISKQVFLICFQGPYRDMHADIYADWYPVLRLVFMPTAVNLAW